MRKPFVDTPARRRQRQLYQAKGTLSATVMLLRQLMQKEEIPIELYVYISKAHIEVSIALELFNKQVGWKEKKEDL